MRKNTVRHSGDINYFQLLLHTRVIVLTHMNDTTYLRVAIMYNAIRIICRSAQPAKLLLIRIDSRDSISICCQ